MATDVGRAPPGQALVQAPSPTVSALTGFDPWRCQLRKYDAISRQIMAEGDFVVGLILQLANGRWFVEIDGERIGRWTERTPQAAFIRWRDAAIAMEAASATGTATARA